MNKMLFRTLIKRYEAEIEDALYKIGALDEHNLVKSILLFRRFDFFKQLY